MEVPTWLVWVISLLLLLNVGGFILLSNNDVEAVVDFTEQNAKLDALAGGLIAISQDINAEPEAPAEGEEATVEPGSYSLSKSEFEEEALETEALKLATDSVMSRDFEKAAYDALVNEGVDIDSYKDITEVRVLDSDVDENEVEFDVKLYYFLDEDEDETERARLVEFTVVVDDLDFDDEFEDGEVDEDYLDNLTVLRVYD